MSRGNIVSLVILGGLIVFFVIRKRMLVNDAVYTKGVIYRQSWSGKGHHYIDYSFNVNGQVFHGSMPIEFCLTANTNCGIGDTVLVRYQKNNPSHNDLVHKRR